MKSLLIVTLGFMIIGLVAAKGMWRIDRAEEEVELIMLWGGTDRNIINVRRAKIHKNSLLNPSIKAGTTFLPSCHETLCGFMMRSCAGSI